MIEIWIKIQHGIRAVLKEAIVRDYFSLSLETRDSKFGHFSRYIGIEKSIVELKLWGKTNLWKRIIALWIFIFDIIYIEIKELGLSIFNLSIHTLDLILYFWSSPWKGISIHGFRFHFFTKFNFDLLSDRVSRSDFKILSKWYSVLE